VIAEAQTVDVGALSLSKGGRIEGTCVDHLGRVFVEGAVTAQRQDPNNPASSLDSKTVKPDFDGRFQFGNLEQGEWRVILIPERIDGKDVNPLIRVTYQKDTEQIVPVRDGQTSTVKLILPAPR
jgi:hypothetical protein